MKDKTNTTEVIDELELQFLNYQIKLLIAKAKKILKDEV
jgi:hypothetical protein